MLNEKTGKFATKIMKENQQHLTILGNKNKTRTKK